MHLRPYISLQPRHTGPICHTCTYVLISADNQRKRNKRPDTFSSFFSSRQAQSLLSFFASFFLCFFLCFWAHSLLSLRLVFWMCFAPCLLNVFFECALLFVFWMCFAPCLLNVFFWMCFAPCLLNVFCVPDVSFSCIFVLVCDFFFFFFFTSPEACTDNERPETPTSTV